MLDSRLKFLTSRAEEGPAELVGLESTGRFALTTEGVKTPRVRVLLRLAEGHGADDLGELSRDMGLTVLTRAGDVVGGEIGIDRLTELDELEAVGYVEASRPTLPELDAAVPETKADKVHTGPPGLRGAGVIVGVVDSGIDWRHGCFRDPTGKTRILRIWDQNLTPETGESSPAPFGHGVEYERSAIDSALSAPNPMSIVRHMDDSVGHGTHVAGIAAGDGSSAGNGKPAFTFVGIAPEADLVVVANRVTTEAMGDSMGTLEAVGYIFKVAETLGRPAVVNISQGDNLGPHDGSSLLERGIDNLLNAPGRALVKSAGNAANAGVHATGQVAEEAATSCSSWSPSATTRRTRWTSGIRARTVCPCGSPPPWHGERRSRPRQHDRRAGSPRGKQGLHRLRRAPFPERRQPHLHSAEPG